MLIMQIAVLALIVLLIVLLFGQMTKNSKLTKENKKLNEILEVKNITISNYEASRVAVKDTIENSASSNEVMDLIHAGESKTAVAEKLGIPISKIELMIKFDKLKKRD